MDERRDEFVQRRNEQPQRVVDTIIETVAMPMRARRQ